MLETIEIKNYKSIENLELNLGRINIFIGENGCGKSNILEAIALIGATAANKLDNEFLATRGIRVSSPDLMRSAFDSENKTADISFKIKQRNSNQPIAYKITHKADSYSKWENISPNNLHTYEGIKNSINRIEEMHLSLSEEIEKVEKRQEELSKEEYLDLITGINEVQQKLQYLNSVTLEDKMKDKHLLHKHLVDFVIYSPENTALRQFYKEGQIEPLGINGEGLLKLLRVISREEPKKFSYIQEKLQLLSWFDSISMPTNQDENEGVIHISDKYLSGTSFDQRSANEGFLFILFYIALIVSKDTPKFFAIDNIDASLNPKLCTRLIEDIVEYSERFEKQIIMTTHNPAILDGLDLNDPEQKLFVVSRKRSGETRIKEITADKKPKTVNGEYLKLSDAMLRGYLGGLPKGF